MQPTKFRKKPVEIEAFQMTEDVAFAHVIDNEPLPFAIRIGNHNCHPGRRELHSWSLSIETLEGRMNVSRDDWIIKGVKGELYPCKPDIFQATYERST